MPVRTHCHRRPWAKGVQPQLSRLDGGLSTSQTHTAVMDFKFPFKLKKKAPEIMAVLCNENRIII